MLTAREGKSVVPPSPVTRADERYIRVRDILTIGRKNFPSGAVPIRAEPETLDDCRLVEGAEIEQFRFTGDERWASYPEIVAEFKRPRDTSGISPYFYEEVFAPLKVVIRDQVYPIRAVLTYEPVYPIRGKLGVPRPGQPLALVYAAVAVLNSYLGQAWYREQVSKRDSPPRPGTAYVDALRGLPVARRDYVPERLDLAAQLTHQVVTLYEAERECRRDFSHALDPLRQRLAWAITALLGLDERKEQSLKQSVADLDLADARQPNLWSLDPPVYPLPPILLCSSEERQQCEVALDREAAGTASGADLVHIEKVQPLLYWQDLVNSPLPEELSLIQPGPRHVVPTDEAA